MFRHIVLLSWTEESTPEQRAAVPAELSRLPEIIEEIREYRIGLDAGINTGNADLAVVADFDDADAYLVYRDHPEHQKVIANHIRPILASRASIQF